MHQPIIANTTFTVAGVNNLTGNFLAGLSPILSLFGRDVTNQFLSQSLSYLDWIIFAVGPLGVPFAITAGIRVWGHGYLQILAGLSNEIDADIEKDLMPSTSMEVCEVWDGRKAVRVEVGTSQMKELVFSPEESDTKHGLQTSVRAKTNGLLEIRHGDDAGSAVESAVECAKDETAYPPNLVLNLGIYHRELFEQIAASIGLTLLGGFLLTASLTTFYPPLSDDFSLSFFSFLGTIIGTVVVTVFLVLCASEVTKASKKMYWKPRAGASTLYLIWLQRHEKFGSYVITKKVKDEIISCHRTGKLINRKRANCYVLFIPVGILSGFVLQFIAISGMKYPTQVYQLFMTIIMGLQRITLRRHDQPSACTEIHNKHEMDWLALAKELDPEVIKGHEGKGEALMWNLCAGCVAPRDGLSCTSNSSFNTSSSERKSQAILKVRQHLAETCGLDGPASEEADILSTAITKAIKLFEDLFNVELTELEWCINVQAGTFSIPEPVEFKVTKSQPCQRQLEAALSLMLFHKAHTKSKEEASCSVPRDSQDLEASQGIDGRVEKGKGKNLHLLGLQKEEIPERIQTEHFKEKKIYLVRNTETTEGTISTDSSKEIGHTRIVGFKANHDLLFENHASFETEQAELRGEGKEDIAIAVDEFSDCNLYMQHIFSSLVWAVAATVKKKTPSGQDLRGLRLLEKRAGEFHTPAIGDSEVMYWLIIAPFIALDIIPKDVSKVKSD